MAFCEKNAGGMAADDPGGGAVARKPGDRRDKYG